MVRTLSSTKILKGVLLLAALLPSVAVAGPFSVKYAGRLTDIHGAPLSSVTTLEVRFFRQSIGGEPVLETPLFKDDLKIQDGVFQFEIDLSPEDFEKVFNGTHAVWLELTDAANGRKYARQQLSAVPFARKVPVDGESIKYNDSGELVVGTLPAASAGAAGIIKASPSYLTVDASGNITGLHADAADSATTATTAQNFSGNLTGDVSGTQGATLVERIRNRAIADVTPSDGQVLKWSSVRSQWEPDTDDGGVAGAISSGLNLGTSDGTTADIFAGTSAPDLQFRRLKEGSGINLSQASNTVTVEMNVTATPPLAWTPGTGTFSIGAATTGAAGSMSAADKAKLDGIADGADDVNATTVGLAGAVMDTDFSSNGMMKRTGAGAYDVIAEASSNTAGTLVLRDGSGNFSAGTITATLSGNATNVTGTVAIANGGTGQTTANAALNALLPVQTTSTSHVLSTNGTNTAWIAYGTSGADTLLRLDSSGKLPALDGSALTSLSATSISGSVPIANGGTGQTTANAALNALLPAQGGSSSHILATNGTNTSWLPYGTSGANTILKLDGTGKLPALDGSALTNLSAGGVSGTVAISNGGTGQTTANAALNALLPAQGGNTSHILTTDGTNTAWTPYGTSGADTVLKLDGTGKLPALDGSALTSINATSIAGRPVDGTAPTSGQFLAWNGSAWIPTTPPFYSSECTLGTYVIGFESNGAIKCSTGSLGYKKLDAGQYHTCGLVSDNTVRCWGDGTNGRLGNKFTADSKKPVAVKLTSGAVLTNVIDLSVGYAHACAIVGTGTPGTEGTVWCWGLNSSGQLGDASTTSRSFAVQAAGITTATQVSAGYSHSCARLSDGSAKCWGNNDNNRLGDGTTTQRTSPVTVLAAAATPATNVSYITAGRASSCYALNDGSAWCWGYNNYGALGDGTTTNRVYPTPVSSLSSGANVTKIVSGTSYNANYAYGHTCAIRNGEVWCWGYNSDGQLGDGSTTQRTVPVQMTSVDVNADGTTDSVLGTVYDVAVGGYHTCLIADTNTGIDTTKGVHCAGYSGDYAVTNIGTADRTRPISIQNTDASAPLENALSIAVNMSNGGTTYSSVIIDDTGNGSGYGLSWGDNSQGQLGDDTTTDTGTAPPVFVVMP